MKNLPLKVGEQTLAKGDAVCREVPKIGSTPFVPAEVSSERMSSELTLYNGLVITFAVSVRFSYLPRTLFASFGLSSLTTLMI